MNRIVVPVDGSEGSRMAASFAASLARQTNAMIELLYVYDAPTAAQMGLARGTDLERAKLQVSRGSFDGVAPLLSGIEVRRHVAIGHPAREIVEHARAVDADLIVIGSRGLSEIAGLLLGSVSESVLRLAPCPVTVVR